MRPTINVLIADKREDYVSTLKSELQGESGINAVGITGNGNEALSLAKELGPEFLLIDSNLDGIDGVEIVREILAGKVSPRPIIITTDFDQSNEMSNLVILHEASHALYQLTEADKPVELINAITDDIFTPIILNEYNPTVPDRIVSEMLKDMGTSVNTKGFRNSKALLTLAVEKHGKGFSLTKELYPETARQYDTTPAAVERSLRHTVGSVWKEKNNEALEHYLKINTVNHPNKPKNSEFIYLVARYVIGRMEAG